MNIYVLLAAGLLLLTGCVILGTALVLACIELYRRQRSQLLFLGGLILLGGLAAMLSSFSQST